MCAAGKETQERERRAKESAKDVPSTERLDSTRRIWQSKRIHEDRHMRRASLDVAEPEHDMFEPFVQHDLQSPVP